MSSFRLYLIGWGKVKKNRFFSKSVKSQGTLFLSNKVCKNVFFLAKVMSRQNIFMKELISAALSSTLFAKGLSWMDSENWFVFSK